MPAAQLRSAIAMLARRITLRGEHIDIEIAGGGLYAFHAAATALCHRAVASARKIRRVFSHSLLCLEFSPLSL
jgi:hypothetical protein